MKYLLAHDLGTSGNKATLYSVEGKLVKSIVHSYDTFYFDAVCAEQDSNIWWEAVKATTKELLKEIDPKDCLAVSFSGQMMGCLCVDKDGNALRNSIIWADQRAGAEADEIAKTIPPKEYYLLTGHRLSGSYGIEKLMWIKTHEPEVYEKTYKVLNAKDYIVLKLTGVFTTEITDACGMGCVNLKTQTWDEQIVKAAGIAMDKLPDIKKSTDIAGTVTKEASLATGLKEGTPVVCGAGDGSCAAVGCGAIEVGQTYCSMGSSSWIQPVTKEPINDEEMRTFNWIYAVDGLIMPSGTMQTGGAALAWVRNEICKSEMQQAKEKGVSAYALIDEQAAKAPIGSNGLLFMPYLLGERSPRWNANARGAFVGLKMEHSRNEVLRSVLEGISYNMNVILSIFKKHIDIPEIILIGGGAKGKVWRQMMADIYNTKILKPVYLEEAPSMGAAMIAGVGCGAFESFREAVDIFVTIEDELMPNPEAHAQYEPYIEAFEVVYENLVPVYDALAKLK